jgi:hypothetical protein
MFNDETGVLWSLLDTAGRREFIRAENAWLEYRDQECEANARAELGGTASPIQYASCETQVTRSRDQELGEMIAVYCQGTDPVGSYRRCPHPSSPRSGIGKG